MRLTNSETFLQFQIHWKSFCIIKYKETFMFYFIEHRRKYFIYFPLMWSNIGTFIIDFFFILSLTFFSSFRNLFLIQFASIWKTNFCHSVRLAMAKKVIRTEGEISIAKISIFLLNSFECENGKLNQKFLS